LTVGPAHGRLYDEHMELINRLFIVPPIVDGYRTMVWGGVWGLLDRHQVALFLLVDPMRLTRTSPSKRACGSSTMFRIAARRIAILVGLLAAFGIGNAHAQERALIWNGVKVPDEERVHLSPLIGHPDEALVRALMIDRVKFLQRQFEGFDPDGNRKGPMPTLYGRDFPFAEVFVGRVTFAPVGQTQLAILFGYKEARWDSSGYEAWLFESDGAGWRLATDLFGFRNREVAFFSLAVNPVRARVYDEHMGLVDKPFMVPPVVDGYRTVFWGDDGRFWTGKDWRYFCWAARCD